MKAILDFIHPGETLVVTRIDRLARSMRDLQTIVAMLKDKGAHLAATEQPVDTSTAAGKTFFDMLGVFAEFETNLRRDLLAACRQVAETHGLTAEGGELSDVDLRHGFGIQFRVGIPLPDGSLFSHDKALFDVLAPSFGLEPSDHGRIFRTGGETFRMTGIIPNRPKYPISAERLADGRGFKFSADNVTAYL